MPYGKKLYKNNSRVYASDIIYDETEEKLQSEINADVKADVDILKDHDGVITGEKTYSGSVATILDAEYEMPLKSCVVDIEPVQDLHGYDHPWPEGGGKNLFNKNAQQTTVYASATIDGEKITVTGTYYCKFALNLPAGQYSVTGNVVSYTSTKVWRFEYDDGTLSSTYDIGNATTITVEKPIVGIYLYAGSSSSGTSVYENIQVERGNACTAFAPYSNICPISGWTGANVTRTGKNLFDKTAATDGKSVITNGIITDRSDITLSDYIPVVPNTDYYVQKSFGASNWYASAVYDSGKTFLRNVNLLGTNQNGIINTGDDAAFIRVNFRIENKDSAMLEIGSSESAYTPFTKITTIPITFPSEAGTVYGGTLDVTSGVLTVTMAEVDLGTLTWTTVGSGRHNVTVAQVAGIKIVGNVDTVNALCSQYKACDGNGIAAEDMSFAMINNTFLQINDSTLNGVDAASFKTNMSGVQLVYELASPQTYQLTPTEVTTLLGQNNIWSNTGNILISYGGLISVIDRSIDTLTDRLDNLKANQVKARGLGDVEAEPGDIVTVTDAAEFPVKDLKVKIEPIQDLHGKANPYPVLEKEPYLFRQSGGSQNNEVNGYAHDVLVGGTVAWNQLVNPSKIKSTFTDKNVTITNNNDGSVTLSGTADSSGYIALTNVFDSNLIENNIYYIFSINTSTNLFIGNGYGADGVDSGGGSLLKYARSSGGCVIYAHVDNNISYTQKLRPILINLTQMFGTAIADRAYAMEQASKGSGIAWLKSMGFFTKDYYEYDPGSLQSVKVGSHFTRGFNQWDEEVESGEYNLSTGVKKTSSTRSRSANMIPILPNVQYYTTAITYHLFYDKNKQFISSDNRGDKLFTTPASAYYMTFFVSNNELSKDICINLSDPARNGDYVPYDGHTYPLDTTKEWRGILKLDANNKVYADGDIYPPDGNATRKYGIVDLGTLDWGISDSIMYATPPNMLAPSITQDRQTGIISSVYPIDTQTSITSENMTDNTMLRANGRIWIYDSSYVDPSAFKTAMQNEHVQLVYELATPTSESALSYEPLQLADPNGTEEYVDYAVTAQTPTRDVAIPCGHSTTYGNICPIEGRTGCNVTRTGKNLLSLINLGYTSDSELVVDSANNCHIVGPKNAWTVIKPANIKSIIRSGVQYRLSASSIDAGIKINIERNGRGLYAITPNSLSTTFSITYSESDTIQIVIFNNENIAGNSFIKDLMLITSEPDSSYEPGDVITFPISWQSSVGTVYGGTLDVTTGMLMVTMASVNMDDVGWTNGGTYFNINKSNLSPAAKAGNDSGLLCSCYITKNSGDYKRITRTANSIRVYDSAYEYVSDFVTAMSGQTMVYELATPQTYQLTPTQVTLLQGYNNIWSDVGPIESLTYLGTEATNVQNEIDEFENKLGGIQKSISAIQDDMIAIRNYEPNEFVTVGKNLYIITANVSKGVSLIEGTNCRETTVMEQITNLLNIIASQNS